MSVHPHGAHAHAPLVDLGNRVDFAGNLLVEGTEDDIPEDGGVAKVSAIAAAAHSLLVSERADPATECTPCQTAHPAPGHAVAKGCVLQQIGLEG